MTDLLIDRLPRRRSNRAPGLALAALLAGLLSTAALADEAAIRKNLAERLANFPKIDEVTKTPMAGLYEVRLGTDIVYTDEQGSFLIQGVLIDTDRKSVV